MTIVIGEPNGEVDTPAEGTNAIVRSALFTAVLLLTWIGLQPFPDLSAATPELERPTDIIYHAVALTLCGSCLIVAIPILRGALPSLVRPFAIMLILWLLISVVTSQHVELSSRRFFVAMTDITLALTVLLVPRGLEDFSRLLAVTAGCILVVCYLGILLAPTLSIHQFTDANEVDLAGNWRGLFGHKNTAGAAMAMFIIIGLFVAGTGRSVAGVTIAATAAVFLLLTQSKNSIVLLPVTLVLALGVERAKSLWARFSIGLGPLVLLNLLTVGTVYLESLKRLVEHLPIDQTFTGRTQIWAFVAEHIAERPFFGQGLRAFWYTNTVVDAEAAGNEWIAGVVNSHNGYLDLALTIGLPGLALMIVVFLVYPLLDYHRRQIEWTNEPLASLFLRIWLFEIYTSTFESFFFDRAFSAWFITLMAIFGLRYVAKLRIAP